MDVAVAAGIGLVLAIVGFAIGRSSGRRAGLEKGRQESHAEGHAAGLLEGRGESERRIRALTDAISRGKEPEDASPGTAEGELHRALEQGWVPREEEYQRALRAALSRIGGFLEQGVREPLSGGGDSNDAAELRERIDRALGSLEDLEFFLAEPMGEAAGQDLAALVRQVTREFALDQNVGVRVQLDDRPVRAVVNPQGFMDALYLVLHNAGRFGQSDTVTVTVTADEGWSSVKVRDRGPGFTKESFRLAFDPFYSTTDDGLGLGLPHARKVIEGMGGRIELENVPDGGAEVELVFPVA